MILPGIFELTLVGVYERGIPNQERIVFRATQTVDVGQFGIILGIKNSPGMAVPIRDNFFWFGDGILNDGDWVFLYTCPGKSTGSVIPNTDSKLYTVFWGRKKVVLSDSNIVPMLIRLDAVTVAGNQLSLPP